MRKMLHKTGAHWTCPACRPYHDLSFADSPSYHDEDFERCGMCELHHIEKQLAAAQAEVERLKSVADVCPPEHRDPPLGHHDWHDYALSLQADVERVRDALQWTVAKLESIVTAIMQTDDVLNLGEPAQRERFTLPDFVKQALASPAGHDDE